MILSGSMMLDWLGQKYKNNTLSLDAIKIRNAVETVMLDKENLTSDLGGKASTTQTAEAVSRQLKLLN
jgi:isocitrate/isopropylmalate dehydrogenase